MTEPESEVSPPPQESRVRASDMVVVEVCERRSGPVAMGEPYGKVRLRLKLPRSTKRCWEEATLIREPGVRGLNIVFDGRVVPLKGAEKEQAELVVIEDATVQSLEERAKQLRHEIARLEAQAVALTDNHLRLIQVYGGQEKIASDNLAAAQAALAAVRAQLKTEDEFNHQRIVALQQTELVVAQGFRDRSMAREQSMRASYNEEAAAVNAAAEILADAKAKTVPGGKVAATVDAIGRTTKDVLDHPLVTRAALGILGRLFPNGSHEPEGG